MALTVPIFTQSYHCGQLMDRILSRSGENFGYILFTPVRNMVMGFLHRFSRYSHIQLYHVKTICIKCHQNRSGNIEITGRNLFTL